MTGWGQGRHVGEGRPLDHASQQALLMSTFPRINATKNGNMHDFT